MVNFPVNVTDLRLLLPKVIELEPEHFELSREISNRVTDEAPRWQTYLNILALLGFEAWIRERIPDKPVHRDTKEIEPVCHLKVGEFKLCLIATEHLLDEVVNVPQNAIEQAEKAAHFYVILEVLEEEEEVIIRGVLRYDQLVDYRSRLNLQPLQNGY